MDFGYTQEQLQLKQMIKKFVDEELIPVAGQYDKNSDPEKCIPWPLIEKCLSLGIGKAIIPEKFGGSEMNNLDVMIIAEELARGDAGFTATVLSGLHFAHTIMHFGTDEQKEKWLGLIVNDKTNRFLTGSAFSEPQSGADAMSSDPRSGIQTGAILKGNEYILNGKKCFITNGGIAQAYLVWARTDKTKGAPQGGLSTFIVPANAKGLKIGKIEDKLGQRLSQQSELIFENCKIPKENLIAEEGMGFNICVDLIASSFTSVGAIGVGIAQASFDYSYNYAKERVQGGTEIINHQAISHKLANILMNIESTRNLVNKSAWSIDNGQPAHLLASMCKIQGSELAFQSANDALQIFGGYGYTREYPVEKLLRDSRILSIYEASNETHRTNIIEMVKMFERMHAG